MPDGHYARVLMDEPTPEVAERDRLLTDVIACHFEGARCDGTKVLVPTGMTIRCAVEDCHELGSYVSASLYFQVAGGRFGDTPVFASISGYGANEEEAIRTGGCHWACTLRRLLQAAFHDEPSDVTSFDTVVHGLPCRVFVDGIDRAFSYGDDPPPSTEEARTRLGGDPWLTPLVLSWEAMPPLPRAQASLLSVFVGELPRADRIVEVKIHGVDWPGANGALAEAPASDHPGALLRELAIVVPRGEGSPLEASTLARTLKHARAPHAGGKRSLTDWRGWDAHGGELGPVATEAEVVALERDIGPLPPDYRRFVRNVQHRGAGPGYGLVSPLHPAQRVTAKGVMTWRHDESPSRPAQGVLLLAHAGCGNAWLLALNGSAPGTIWIDAGGSDGRARKVADSFTEWYEGWLDALVRDVPRFVHWEGAACATVQVFSQLLASLNDEGFVGEAAAREVPKRVGPGAIRCLCQASDYFDARDTLEPCQACCQLARRFALRDDVFARGAPPRADRPIAPTRSWFRRLFSGA